MFKFSQISILGILVSLWFGACYPVFGQESLGYSKEGFGGAAGISFNLGTHFQRAGLFLTGYYYHDFFQVNAQTRWFFTFRQLGPSGKGHEGQFNIGAVYAFGNYDQIQNPFLNSVSNQTGKKYSIGYSFNVYLDQLSTNQRTGTVGIQLDQVEVYHENDILGTPGSDRYRTSGILIAYRNDHTRIGINATFWTGNSDSGKAIKVEDNTFARFGYTDLTHAEYGEYSNGLLSLQVEHVFPYAQQGRMNIGIDSEHVRNFLQNKVMHDLYFWPEKWNPAKNYHIPMVDTEGKPYLYKENQGVKSDRFLFDLSLNPTLFY
ncbi:polymorphic toxin type 23 domain-containing protein [Flexithrix dorotheae]|uniref:polymorphic toxin type 23 domain-containing protein n=1 Tax=Flexithrix dorotheae TaxID=70993 RepID=UPI000370B318|nr:polymorphic toxin type 23 domain-containing protein [Flexithrix dorotheae]